MSKRLTNSDMIARSFLSYMLRFLSKKKSTVLTVREAEACLGVALQKYEADCKFNDLLQLPESKIDVSGENYDRAVNALQLIAQWNQGDVVDGGFDEPSAARIARNTLQAMGIPGDGK